VGGREHTTDSFGASRRDSEELDRVPTSPNQRRIGSRRRRGPLTQVSLRVALVAMMGPRPFERHQLGGIDGHLAAGPSFFRRAAAILTRREKILRRSTTPFVNASFRAKRRLQHAWRSRGVASSAGQCCRPAAAGSCVASISNSQRSSSFKTSSLWAGAGRSCACRVFRPRVSLFRDPGADPSSGGPFSTIIGGKAKHH
jgi:hypothetical protein